MSLENKARTGDYERIVQSDRTIHNYNPEQEPQTARMYRVKNNIKRKSKIGPILLTALISGGIITYVGINEIKNNIGERKAEQTYSQIETKYVPYEKDGTINQDEKNKFLYRVIKGKAFVENPGELPVYSDGRIVPIEDLAKMAVEYSSKQ